MEGEAGKGGLVVRCRLDGADCVLVQMEVALAQNMKLVAEKEELHRELVKTRVRHGTRLSLLC